MTKEMVLVVGLGEVGCAFFELLKESERFTVYGFDIDRERMLAVQQTEIPKEVDTIHVCIARAGGLNNSVLYWESPTSSYW